MLQLVDGKNIGSLAKGELGAAQDESLLWLQAQALLMQLHAAAWTSYTAISKFASEIEASVSEVQAMVQEMAAVPKQTVLPVFHRIGRLFEVQWPPTTCKSAAWPLCSNFAAAQGAARQD